MMRMKYNTVIQTMLEHRSIRKYKREMPSDEVIETVVTAAKQAPFASQSYSILMSRRRDRHPYKAPLLFTLCVDYHTLELIMARRGWKTVTNDLTLMFFGIQDVSLMAENMVIAGRSLGLGSCLLGSAMYNAERIAKQYRLPKRVFPLVQLVMGYPDEDPPPRPRYPMEFTLFEDRYPEMDEDAVSGAMSAMDRGYIAQDYYRKQRAKISLENNRRRETFTYADYSWTEHISRKWGQWYPEPKELVEQMRKRGFDITKSGKQDV